MRRNALGPVSHNTLNSRTSVGASATRNPRASLALKPPDARRASAMPSVGAGSRRSTAAPHNSRASSSAMRSSLAHSSRSGHGKDPRPLTSKSFIKESVERLVDFLSKHDYDQLLTPKQLFNPSARDFESIFRFMLRLLDPTFDFAKRFEEEIPILLKCLHYPFPLSRSAFSAVGSPHTWPPLLGLLVWLAGLVTYADNCHNHESNETALDKNSRRDAHFYNNTIDAYASFLDGADEYPEHDAALQSFFEEDDANRAQEVDKLQNEIDALNQTLTALRKEESPLHIAQAHSNDLQGNLEKLRVLLDKLHEHYRVVSAKQHEVDDELATVRAGLDSVATERVPVAATLQRQEDASINAEQIASERDRLRDALADCETARIEADRAVKQRESAVTTASEDLNEALAGYHAELEILGRAARGAGVRSAIDVCDVLACRVTVSSDENVTDAHALMGRSNGEDLAGRLDGMAQRLRDGVPELQERVLRLSNEADEVEEQLMVSRDQRRLREEQLKKRESEYASGKEQLGAALSDRSSKILGKEEEMKEARRRLEEEVREAERHNAGLREQLSALSDRFAVSRTKVMSALDEDVRRLHMHQEDVQQALMHVQERCEATCRSAGFPLRNE